MAKIVKKQEVAISKLKPYEKNAKLHSDEQVQKIADSIEEFGFLNPCLIDKDFNLIAGHGRVEACKLLGMETVPCLFVEGLTEAQRRAYILADNRLTELGDWDMDLVTDELIELQDMDFNIELTGFELEDLDDSEVEEDDYEFPSDGFEESRVKKGQLWQLGRHRLMCGDSLVVSDVEKLTGGGIDIDLLVTDPPYNVAYVGKTEDEMTIENDSMSPEVSNYKQSSDFCKIF